MNLSKSNIFVLLLMCFKSCVSERVSGEKCEIDGEEGECVPLPDCPQLVSLLKNTSSTEEGLRATHDAKCGLDGVNVKVCCTLLDKIHSLVSTRALEEIEDDSDLIVDAFPGHETCGWTDVDRSIIEVKIISQEEYMYDVNYVIANGKPALTRDMARYMALLGYEDGSAVLWNCGGSVITEKHILTAAHCIKPSLFVVRVGELDLTVEEKDASPIDFYIKRKIPHEGYTKYHNDIGILVLDGRINFEEEKHIGPICLPLDRLHKELSKKYQAPGIFITGWGETLHKNHSKPTWLSFAKVNILRQNMCKRLYSGPNRTIDNRVFCAGDRNLEHDACNGDSGGPIAAEYKVSELNRTFFYQLGVISYGYRCSETGAFSGVYTNVTTFLPWIKEKVLGTRGRNT